MQFHGSLVPEVLSLLTDVELLASQVQGVPPRGIMSHPTMICPGVCLSSVTHLLFMDLIAFAVLADTQCVVR